MAYIRVDQPMAIFDGQAVTFKSPAKCTGVEGLKVYYPLANGTITNATFALADAHGNNVGSIDLFAANVLVKVILDTENNMAFVQNADTNAYLEGKFTTIEQNAKSYTDAKIAAIPEPEPPDVSGQIATHNESTTAHSDIRTLISGKADSGHKHSTSDITSGTLPVARGGTGASTAEAARTALAVPSVNEVNATVNTHNSSTSAHSDIRTAVTNAQNTANAAQTTANSKAPMYQYSTTDLTAGSSPLTTGTLYFVYE